MSGFGDVRDVLVRLPREPWGSYQGSYVVSDLFPAKHRVLRELVPDARSVFEIGALMGHFLVTALDALPDADTVGWVDPEQHTPGSNAAVHANLDAWQSTSGRRVRREWWPKIVDRTTRPSTSAPRALWDVVHIDGAHSLEACATDLGYALGLHPRLILVDDTIAIREVRTAVEGFVTYTGLDVVWHGTVNGFASIEVPR